MVSRRKRKLAAKSGNAHGADFGVAPARYAAWIAYVFDRPSSRPAWYFELDHPPFDTTMTSVDVVGLFGLTITRAGTDLAGFSNAEVSQGLTYLFSAACSDHVHAFADDSVPMDHKTAAIRAMKHLYQDCFAPRCDRVLGHLDGPNANPLNYNAYMLWDDTPIFHVNRHREAVAAAIVEVLDFALGSSNEACIEGALHGLGHGRRSCALIDPVIDRFLATTRDADGRPGGLRPIRKELRTYAQCARTGRIL